MNGFGGPRALRFRAALVLWLLLIPRPAHAHGGEVVMALAAVFVLFCIPAFSVGNYAAYRRSLTRDGRAPPARAFILAQALALVASLMGLAFTLYSARALSSGVMVLFVCLAFGVQGVPLAKAFVAAKKESSAVLTLVVNALAPLLIGLLVLMALAH